MARKLAETNLLVSADRRIVVVCDHAALDGHGPPFPTAPGAWIGADQAGVMLISRQTLRDVRLCLQRWSSRPAEDVWEWEVDETVGLTLPSGEISVETILNGTIPRVLTGLRPGPHLLRVTGRGREETAKKIDELFKAYDIDDPSFDAWMSTLTGQEQYLLRFWPAE